VCVCVCEYVCARAYVYGFIKYEAFIHTLKLIRKQESGGFNPQNKIKKVNTNKIAQNTWMERVQKNTEKTCT